jgi:hypothetical protein
MLNQVRRAINDVVAKSLHQMDPIETEFKSFSKQLLSLKGCSVKLDITSLLRLSGLNEAGIEQLRCESSTCLEPGKLGTCKKTEYVFGTTITIGNLLRNFAQNTADWKICGLISLPSRTMTTSFNVVEPIIKAQLSVEHVAFSTDAKITDTKTLDLSWGQAQNFKCSFADLPGFIGSNLESWCESILEWGVDKTHKYVLTTIGNLFMKLMNRVLDVSE